MAMVILFDNMQRYFVTIEDNQVLLDDLDVHHITHVMRMTKGDNLELVFDQKLYLGVISSINPLKVEIVKELSTDVELDSVVTIIFALSKSDKNDFVIQKATELGVKRIIFVPTKRSIVKMDKNDFDKKMTRYEKISKEAAEQCHRLVIPDILYHSSIDKLPLSDINLVAYEEVAGNTTQSFDEINRNKSVSVFIGPEGGFDEQEIALLKDKGFTTISLGKRILRCETAAVYALSVISYLLEK